MRKSLIIAAALSAMALSGAGTASAASMTGHLGKGITTQSEVQKVHYSGRRHWHPRKHHRHCFIRVGHRVCVLR